MTLSDITNILRERDQLRFTKIGINASGTYPNDPDPRSDEEKAKHPLQNLFTKYANGKVILEDPAVLTKEELALYEAWQNEEKKQSRAQIVGKKGGPLGRRGPADKPLPLRKRK